MKRLFALLMALLLLTGCKAGIPSSPSAQVIPEETPREIAEEIHKQYDIQVLTGEAAAASAPWDYTLIPQTENGEICSGLAEIRSCLALYPKGMIQVLSRDAGGLRFCLLKEIRGKEGTGSVPTAKGLQFRDPEGHCILALSSDLTYTLCHELCHVIEDFAVTRSSGWENWEQLNPEGFSYDLDFQKNLLRDPALYLTGDQRAFIDTYSMSFPREDRARIMEYAMNPGNAPYFESPIMQKKLTCLSEGIRKAFGLEKTTQDLPWEQYLRSKKGR